MPPRTPLRFRPRLSLAALGRLTVTLPGLRAPLPRGRRARFVIETAAPNELAPARAAIQRALGGGSALSTVSQAFDLRPLFPGADANETRFRLAHFLVLTVPLSPKQKELGSAAALFDFAHELKAAGSFVRVDPEIENERWQVFMRPAPTLQPAPITPVTPAAPVSGPRPFSVPPSGNPPPGDHAWNLRSINLPAQNNGGAGVLVGQVDTGTRQHPELDGVYLADSSRHFSVIDGSNLATDPLDGTNPAHGVATASVLASRGGVGAQQAAGIGTTAPAGSPGNGEVTGVANRCSVLPVRGVTSVVNVSNIDVAEGLWHCVTQNVDVVTLSVGGYVNPWLERVVSFAVFRDIVVVAAAGQIWPFVVAPACYADCIAVTASDVRSRHWELASSGPQIDVAAPGVDVYCADVKNHNNVVNPGSGTSFSTPTVAGAAALWLAQHGKRNLLARYQGRRKLAEVFRHLLRATARVPAGWDAAEQGAGILDAAALLAAALPSPRAVSGRDWTQYSGTSELQILRENLGNPNESYLLAVLAKWFDTTTGQVQQRLDEFGTELLTVMADVPRATEAIQEALEQQARAATQAVDDAVEDAVQAAGDAVSNALGTVMGWFS